MEDLKKVFEEKKFDEKTLDLLSNFLDEFDTIFGKYLSREDVIERIKNNLNHSVIFTDDLRKSVVGIYNPNDKIIKILPGFEDEKLKSIFFHEMIHCITTEKDFVGLGIKTYDIEDEYRKKTVYSKGMTEGFTQLLTKIRNEKVGVKLDTYPILTELMAEFAEIIGEEKFFDLAFNNPMGIEDAMEEVGMTQGHGDAIDIFKAFNIISENESDIYAKRELDKSAEGRLLKDILRAGRPHNLIIESSKKQIVQSFLEAYKYKTEPTIDGVISLYRKTEKSSRMLDLENKLEIFKICFERFKKIESKGEKRKDLLEQLPEDFKELLITQLKFEEFMKLPSSEIFRRISEDPLSIDREYLGYVFKDDYIEQIGQKLFAGIRNSEHIVQITSELFAGLKDIINENGYNIEKLAFEVIELTDTSGILFNMYETDGNDGRYLGTYSNISSSCDLEEYKVCSEDERIQIAQERNITDDTIVFKSPSGGMLIRSDNGEYLLIDDDELEYESLEVIPYSSNIEVAKKQFERRVESYKQLVALQAPTKIIDHGLDLVKETKEIIEQKMGKKKFTPQDIENATIESVGIEDISSLLEEFKIVGVDREEMFKKGIGYNE